MTNLYNRRQAKLEMYRVQYEQQHQQQEQTQTSGIDRDVDEYDEIDCI